MGFEGDLDWSCMRGSGSGPVVKLGVFQGTATISSNVSSIDTLRTRIGYAQDNWLLYGTELLGSRSVLTAFRLSHLTQRPARAKHPALIELWPPNSRSLSEKSEVLGYVGTSPNVTPVSLAH
jgi:hypothetical protein